MASYGLEERFRPPRYCFRLNDPGAYDTLTCRKFKKNKYPFQSSAPRVTLTANKTYVDAIYDAEVQRKIPNVTSLMSKCPRFPYEAFTEEELEELLCRCGMPCECPVAEEEEVTEVKCMAKTPKCLYKGPAPKSSFTGGLSMPTKRDRGFEVLPDGTSKRLYEPAMTECPPFYDARVIEATQFYRGWKWSKWTSSRAAKSLEVRPGPADYDLDRPTPPYYRCLENLRTKRRLKAKLLRYTELLQQRDIKEGRPGPPHYYPQSPKGTDLKYLGPKADRFPMAISQYEKRPGPDAYYIKGMSDKAPPRKQRPPTGFNVTAPRFRYREHEGPGPADYDAGVKLCKFPHCGTAPFGVSDKRFKNERYDVSDEDDEYDEYETEDERKPCPKFTWQFKSQTTRFKPPHDVFQTGWPRQNVCSRRSPRIQHLAPFFTSQGRFVPWNDWLPVFHSLKTPGPGYYNLEKPKCSPAFHHGPLYRCPRFLDNRFVTPAPNEYNVDRGLETILATHNQRLKDNINNQHKFQWREPPDTLELPPAEQEAIILERALSQLETDVIVEKFENLLKVNKGVSVAERLNKIKGQAGEESGDKPAEETGAKEKVRPKDKSAVKPSGDKDIKQLETSEPKQKLLRTFLYRHPQPMYF